jgi:hypothetical protein
MTKNVPAGLNDSSASGLLNQAYPPYLCGETGQRHHGLFLVSRQTM